MTIVEVHFEDNSTKKFMIEDDTSVYDLTQKVVLKLSLKTDVESFALYESIRTPEKWIDKFLKPTEKCPKKLLAPSVFLFKKRFFFYDNVGDPIVIHMEFIQLREEVLKGRYVLVPDDALELGALDLCITFGKFDGQKHKSGFILSSTVNMLHKYLPKSLLETKKPAAWEKLLLNGFRRISEEPITSEYEGKVRYITKLRDFCPDYFGSIFYDAMELNILDKVIQDRVPVILAVNKMGIHTFKKVPVCYLVRSNAFQEILGWAVHPPTHTFIYTTTNEEEGVRFTFESELSNEIPEACQSYVKLIIRETAFVVDVNNTDDNIFEAPYNL